MYVRRRSSLQSNYLREGCGRVWHAMGQRTHIIYLWGALNPFPVGPRVIYVYLEGYKANVAMTQSNVPLRVSMIESSALRDLRTTMFANQAGLNTAFESIDVNHTGMCYTLCGLKHFDRYCLI